jgi:hypothetical protein
VTPAEAVARVEVAPPSGASTMARGSDDVPPVRRSTVAFVAAACLTLIGVVVYVISLYPSGSGSLGRPYSSTGVLGSYSMAHWPYLALGLVGVALLAPSRWRPAIAAVLVAFGTWLAQRMANLIGGFAAGGDGNPPDAGWLTEFGALLVLAIAIALAAFGLYRLPAGSWRGASRKMGALTIAAAVAATVGAAAAVWQPVADTGTAADYLAPAVAAASLIFAGMLSPPMLRALFAFAWGGWGLVHLAHFADVVVRGEGHSGSSLPLVVLAISVVAVAALGGWQVRHTR